MIEGEDPRTRYERLTKRLEWPVGVLALAIIPALILEEMAPRPDLVRVAIAVNWIIWLVFCAEFALRFRLAPQRTAFLRSAWFGVLIIVLSPPFAVPESMESLRGLRALRLLRLLRVAALASIGVRLLRRALGRRHFLSPVTTEGRIIAVALMLVGIGVIGVFTATVASWFVEQERAPEPADADLRRRLEAIEAKLDALIRQRDV